MVGAAVSWLPLKIKSSFSLLELRIVLVPEHLRRCVLRRPHVRLGPRPLRRLHHLAQPKVRQLDEPLLLSGEEDVLQLEVAVEGAQGVEVGHGFEQLEELDLGLVLVKVGIVGSACRLRGQLNQTKTLEQD